jgi:hypothetical protein
MVDAGIDRLIARASGVMGPVAHLVRELRLSAGRDERN